MRKFSRAVTSLSAFVVLLPAAYAEHAKGPIDLGTLGGTTSQGSAINYAGNVAGSATTAGDAATHAFLSQRHDDVQQLVDLGVLSGGTNSYATGINAFKQVTGTSDFNDPVNGPTSHAFLYSWGKLTDLGTLGGGFSNGNAISIEGIVVGSSATANNFSTHAFWFNPLSKTLNDLGTLGTDQTVNSAAYGINDFGKVVGNSNTGTFDTFGNPITDIAEWDLRTGKVIDLGGLGGGFAQGNAINNKGLVVGEANTSDDSETHAVIVSGGVVKDLGTLGGSFAQANAVNNAGVVVGYSNTSGDTDVHAFVWTPRTGLVDLNTYLPSGTPWVLNSANGINDRGQVTGFGIINGETHAFVWSLFSRDDD